MKITKTKLKRIIKEETSKAIGESRQRHLTEGVKDYIKNPEVHSSIPFGSLQKVLNNNPKLAQGAGNAADPQGQAAAFAQIGELFAAEVDPNSGVRLGDAMDVKGFLRYAEQSMGHLFR
jgi:hypothetical protein